ncbi:TonB-dependent receptor [Pseudoteredinibacter isoporae]|uniref:Outer membrane receptor protein involved in Fe transport n=1 Tax=Pseudoteredinibacter isoporae TaxID=570281 RepID=A0A7X0JR45_9GAMM|nr:TonB-dependent receptor [Pseudoteredinibacter isoporae]MBB6520118.1 outer membrane receptor protein involved in Fe transport [Pseudoteredinibacter isoporae]NHO85690.1 TonB-dependent receptor [Pseudoteredinibacter isoporae]NIB25858.1 TonB-dependent receptor [Pseudoteredinibacter isoporae]
MTLHHRPTVLATAIAMAVGASSTFAQQSTELEEIVVYAQKREQSILEVPVSVSSYSADSLDQAKVRDINDLTQISPSLSIDNSTGASDTSIYIRGMGTSGNNAGFEQSVGIFIDGVYRGRPGSAMSDYVDIEGIEVLKGPQGTLFGRNTSAGVVSVRTAAPSHEAAGTMEVSVGNYGFKQVRASATGSLVEDKLAGRISGSWHERDGFMDNPFTGAEAQNRDRYSLRGQLLWDISDDATLRIIADKSHSDENCCAATPLLYGPAQNAIDLVDGPQFARLPASPFPYGGLPNSSLRDVFDRQFTSNQPYEDKIDDTGISAELNWDLGDTALTVIASSRNYENFQALDADHNSADILTRIQTFDNDERSLEIRWASTGSNTIDWTVGAFVFDQEIEYNSPLPFGTDLRAYVNALGSIDANPTNDANLITLAEVGQAALGNIAPTQIGSLYYGPDGKGGSGNDYSAESFAFFGQATWNVNDDLSVTLGLRYSDEEKKADYIPDFNNPFSEIGPDALFNTYLAALAVQNGVFPLGTPAQVVNATLAGIQGAAAAGDPGSAQLVGGAQQLAAGARGLQLVVPYDPFSANYDDDNISGTISVNYQFNEDMSTYARYARGYKSGGLNLDRAGPSTTPGNHVADPNAVIFEPEVVDTFEVGFKSRLMDNRLQLNAAIFFQELEDYQFQSFIGTGFVVRNAAKTDGKGLEVDFAFKPNENWFFSGGMVWQDVQYDEFPDGPITIAQGVAGQGANTNDLSGQRVVQTSDFNASLMVAYNQPISDDLEFNANVSANYRSDFFRQSANEPLSEQDINTINATVGIGSQDGAWALELWGKNLTDDEVYASFSSTFQTNSLSAFLQQAPRTYGLTAKYNF